MDYGRINVSLDSYVKPEKITTKMGKRDIVQLLLITSLIGFAILGFKYGINLMVDYILASPYLKVYRTSYALQQIVQIFFSILGILIPFSIAAAFIKLLDKKTELLPLDKPNSTKLFAACLPVAFVTIIVANFITAVFTVSLESIGFVFDEVDNTVPENVGEFLWEILSVAIVPALCEEFAIRGIALQSLRRFGDGFAIVLSAFIFAIMHGSFTQVPFAFILGCVMGWMVIKTGSLWTSIAVHFMNNTYAVIISLLVSNLSRPVYFLVAAGINVVGVLLGTFAFIWMANKKKINFRLEGKFVGWQPVLFTVVSPIFIWAVVEIVMKCCETVTYMGIK